MDLVIANGENAAGGFGITPQIAEELFALGVDVITTGNHVWDKKEIIPYIPQNPSLLRPINFPSTAPGGGSVIIKGPKGLQIGVVQVIGRIFMAPAECPFTALDGALARMTSETRVIVVDLHCEATSEKQALGWYLDGRATAALGTHTHVQTADERVLPGGTAYITDIGMTGPRDSVIGVEKEVAIERFLTGMPKRFDVARGPAQFCAAFFQVDSHTGRALNIRRFNDLVGGLHSGEGK